MLDEQPRPEVVVPPPAPTHRPGKRSSREESSNAEDHPLLVKDVADHWTYPALSELVCRLHFGVKADRTIASSSNQRTLPRDLADRVMTFLTIEPVQQVQALGASSHDGVHSLQCSLDPGETTWWLAAPGRMPQGHGQEWVQYGFGKDNNNGGRLYRLSRVSIKIPPLPQGPLSVRDFGLQAFSIDRGWHTVGHAQPFRVQNRTGWQSFDLTERVDVNEVRLVCWNNQISQFFPENLSEVQGVDRGLTRFYCVGFFSVKFE